MATERARALIDSVGPLPVMPSLADELLGLAVSPDADVKRIHAVVERDPVLTAMVLRLVNSASFALRNEVSDLGRAVILLGASHVRSLALAASMSTTFGRSSAYGDTWGHAFSVACGARSVAAVVCPEVVETAFAAGLLHDIGELVLAGLIEGQPPNDPEPGARLALEFELVGADHAELGAALAERWSIPTALVEAINHHHDWAVFQKGGLGLPGIIAAAESVTDTLWEPRHTGATDPVAILAQLGASDPELSFQKISDSIVEHVTSASLPAKGGAR